MSQRKYDIYAHRGASVDRFENTIGAFQEAVRQGADGIEIDVQLTKDGVPVVVHDRNLSRLAARDRNIDELRFPSAKKVRLGSWWQRRFRRLRIPALQEVVHFAQVQQIGVNVELKETLLERPQVVKRVLECLSPLSNVHISSFHYELLEEVKKYDPMMPVAQILRKRDLTTEGLAQYPLADIFHLNHKQWKTAHIEALEIDGRPIRLYGVLGEEEVLMKGHPLIIGWITDVPHVIRQVVMPEQE